MRTPSSALSPSASKRAPPPSGLRAEAALAATPQRTPQREEAASHVRTAASPAAEDFVIFEDARDRQQTPSKEGDRQQTPSKEGELTLSQEGELTPSACRPPDTPNSAWSDGIPAAADDDEHVGDSLRELLF